MSQFLKTVTGFQLMVLLVTRGATYVGYLMKFGA